MHATDTALDTALLRKSFELVSSRAGDPHEITQVFYAHLFGAHGEGTSEQLLEMFPPLMAPQQDKLLKALIRIVTNLDDPATLAADLTALGKDHRSRDVQPAQFELVGQSLLFTLEWFAGEAWTPELRQAWTIAYTQAAEIMVSALTEDDGMPRWWDATVTDARRCSYDIVRLRLQLAQAMDWAPGQSMAMMSEAMPRVWRYFTPANAPRPARTTDLLGEEVPAWTMDLHAKAIPGGMMSTALVRRAVPGMKLRVSYPAGTLRMDESCARPVLWIAGSTGLTPALAMLDRLRTHPAPPEVTLYFGAREPDGLYDRETLDKLAAHYPWLTVRYVVSAPPPETPGWEGEHGSAVDAALRDGSWNDCDAYTCGSLPMVRETASRLRAAGVPEARIHTESFGWEG